MLDRGVEKFTTQDVRGEMIDMGYKFTPSNSGIIRRLDRHTDAGRLGQVSERASSDPRVWMFTEDSGKIRESVLIRLERRRNSRKRTLGDK